MKDDMQRDTSAGSLTEQLATCADGIEHDDLVKLAKMHGLCEMLAETVSAETTNTESDLGASVKALVVSLEQLILGEASDPEGTLLEIQSAVSALSGGTPMPAKADVAMDVEASSEGAAAVADEVPGTNAIGDPATGVAEGASADVTQEAGLPACSIADSLLEELESQESQSPPSEEPPYDQVPLKIDEKEAEFVKAFIEEAGEHLDSIESAVLEVEQAPGDTERIDTLFRPFHTIKGMAGFLNLLDVASLTHEVETLLDQGRKGKRAVNGGLIDLVFDVVDVLKVQVSSIGAWLANPSDEAVPQPPIVELIQYLREVVAGRAEPGARGASSATGDPPKVGESLVEQGSCPQEVVDFALEKQAKADGAAKTGELLVDMGAATPKQVVKALRVQKNDSTSSSTPAATSNAFVDQSVRIDTSKLDSLIDMVGELVIAQAQVSASDMVASQPKLTKDVGQVEKIVRDVQEVAMAMRMIPIGGTFQKMARLVRDVSRKANKQVELVITGEDTELDKTVIQQINDPLVHMVRNAVDHGIEPPEEREAAGKSRVGRVHLAAFHRGGNIVIEITDDGKGLDAQKLINKGIERGLVQPNEELTDSQAFNLVFAPGLSMAKTVTDISGRGVGMDVVRRNIEQLRGGVEISSELGKGSQFSIRLPLTLAIIDGMIVRVGSERFIIQTITVEQALRPVPNQITTVQQRGEMLNMRGRLIPLVQLGALFGLTGRIDPCENMVLIAQCGDSQIGLVVEELLGQQQVVIKSLGERFKGLQGVTGAAILGDGRVGLILEVAGVAQAHNTRGVYVTDRIGPDVAKMNPSETLDTQAKATPGSPVGEQAALLTA